jgi:exosortase
MLAARAVGTLAVKLGQPRVMGEALAGVALGPTVLGAISPTAAGAIFPQDIVPYLGLAAQLGLIFYMFLIGLELDVAEIRARAAQIATISNASVALPLIMGIAVALPLYEQVAPDTKFASFALFMGISMSITAFPVLARILVERRMLKTHVGGVVLAAALGLRWLAGGLMFHQLDCAALLLSLAGLTVAAGGVPLLRGAAPAVLFLVFMVPLPYDVERNVGGPLKEVATFSSTYLLQTLGHPAVAEGHVILIDEVRLGVVDACSGLKMLMTFAAFAVGAVLLVDRTRFEKLMILLGIVPIAVAANVLRITATGVAHTLTHDKGTLDFVHDLHGWLMMPAGLALLGLQLWCLGRLVVRPESPEAGFAPLRAALT